MLSGKGKGISGESERKGDGKGDRAVVVKVRERRSSSPLPCPHLPLAPAHLSLSSATGGARRKGSRDSGIKGSGGGREQGQTNRHSELRRNDFFIFPSAVLSCRHFFLFPTRNLSLFELATDFFVACIFVFVSLPIARMAKRRTLILSRVVVSSGRSSQKCQVKQKNTSRACFYVDGRTHFFLLFFFFSFHLSPPPSPLTLSHSCSLFPVRYFHLGARDSLFARFLSHLTPFT